MQPLNLPHPPPTNAHYLPTPHCIWNHKASLLGRGFHISGRLLRDFTVILSEENPVIMLRKRFPQDRVITSTIVFSEENPVIMLRRGFPWDSVITSTAVFSEENPVIMLTRWFPGDRVIMILKLHASHHTSTAKFHVWLQTQLPVHKVLSMCNLSSSALLIPSATTKQYGCAIHWEIILIPNIRKYCNIQWTCLVCTSKGTQN